MIETLEKPKADIPMIQANLKMIRKALRWTQAEMAERLKVTRPHYGNLECGSHPLPEGKVLLLYTVISNDLRDQRIPSDLFFTVIGALRDSGVQEFVENL